MSLDPPASEQATTTMPDADAVQTARLAIEVHAGVLPGTPETEHTRRYVLTDAEWQAARGDGTVGAVLAEMIGRAQGYAALMMMQPDRYNWVRVDYIYF